MVLVNTTLPVSLEFYW